MGKDYNDALERCKEVFNMNNLAYSPSEIEAKLKYVFPQLKTDEDERIRKWIIDDIRYNLCNETLYNSEYKKEAEKAIAWLEKQGESDETKAKIFLINKGYPIDTNGTFPTYEEIYNIIREGIENQDEHTDNIEPKFKAGDWLQYRNAKPFFVKEITKQGYVNGNSCLPFNWENEIHLWTIQDAKKGDILVFETDEVEWVLIYKEIVAASSEVPHDILRYYSLLADNCCDVEGVCGMVTEDYEEYIKPATKEQRDLLFSKMKEAGYEWIEETKELKKIM